MNDLKIEKWRGTLDYALKKLTRSNIHTIITPETTEKYQGKVANMLLWIWETEGFRAYENGIVWFTNPDEYADVLKRYLKDTPFEKIDTFYVFKRSAFGSLYAVGEKTGHTITINIPYNGIIALEKEMRTISDDRDEEIRSDIRMSNKDDFDCDDYLEIPLFDRALEKFGMLKSDEVYAFDPLLIQATKKEDLSLEHIVVRNIFEYIDEIRSVAKPTVPFAGVYVDTDNV